MISILRHPIYSLRYFACVILPELEIASLENHYRQTHDKGALDQMIQCGEEMKTAVRKFYPKINPRRMPGLLEEIDSYLQSVNDRR